VASAVREVGGSAAMFLMSAWVRVGRSEERNHASSTEPKRVAGRFGVVSKMSDPAVGRHPRDPAVRPT
jgi:hypothetical protein